jgi:signal transduction histidine kinase
MEKRPENHISSYIIQTQEEEIKRIALELHEGVGQTLYSLFTGLQMIENSIEKPAVKSYVKEMAQGLEKTIQEIRLLSVELHPPTLSTLGLIPAVKSYLKLYMSTFGIVVRMESSGGEIMISEQESIALFRVCQEALANIAKYADTCEASLSFTWGEHDLQMVIEDHGKGFDYEVQGKQSSGLAAMKERMCLVGGTCWVSSTIGEGTIIRVSLPLEIV